MATKLEGLQELLDLKVQKLNFFRKELEEAYDSAKRFGLTQDISKLEKEIDDINREIRGTARIEVTGDSSRLEDQIRRLSIDQDINEIHLVNCNREKARKNFWDSYDVKIEEDQRFQFYFILACPTQQPNSFAERMVYEVIIEELEEDIGAINYVSYPDSNRVRIEDLPLGRNARNSIREFKKYFLRRFNLQDLDLSFEDYINTGLPNLDYEFVATVFDLNASKWQPKLMEEYLQWIMDSFKETHPDVPNFMFFFAIFLRDIHLDPISPENKAVLDHVKSIIEKNKEQATLISRLNPIPVTVVEDWIRDLGEQNQAVIEATVKEIVARLPEEKINQYESKNLIDMTDIESFQAIVYKITHEDN